ncbi:MAG: hypothetical protein WC708_15385 [Lentisphaeria bacterium]
MKAVICAAYAAMALPLSIFLPAGVVARFKWLKVCLIVLLLSDYLMVLVYALNSHNWVRIRGPDPLTAIWEIVGTLIVVSWNLLRYIVRPGGEHGEEKT